MPKEAEIHGAQEDFMLRFLDQTQPPKGRQTQTNNAYQQDCYLKIARATVLAFGVEDPLGDSASPTDWVNVEFAQIPAAADMPPLGDPALELRRDTVIAGLVNSVRAFYKRKRHQAKQGGSGPARLSSKHIQRVVDAFDPPPAPPKELDIYQKFYRTRYASALEDAIKDREAAAAGDEMKLAALKKGKGGYERAFASQMYERETEQVKAVVRQKMDEVRQEDMKKYNALWGSPLDMPGFPRAWVLPEASSFLKALLSWVATRFGVALALTIAGVNDNGIPDAQTLFAAGHSKPGAQTLENLVARSMSETKILMSQYARDSMTGEYPKGAPATGSQVKLDADGDLSMEDLTARLNLEREPMRLVRKEEMEEWVEGAASDSARGQGGQSTGTVAGYGPLGESDGGLRHDTMDDASMTGTRVDKGKGVDRSGAGTDAASTGVNELKKHASSYHPFKGGAASAWRNADVGSTGEDAEDVFGAGILDDDELEYAGQSAAWPQTIPLRDTSPETTSSVYAMRRQGLSESPPPIPENDDGTWNAGAFEHDTVSQTGDVEDQSVDDMATSDSDVEKVRQADAYQASLFKDRCLAKTKDKAPRTLLLGAISRSRAGESRKRQRLPPKTAANDDADPNNGDADSKSSKKAKRSTKGGVQLTMRDAESLVSSGAKRPGTGGQKRQARKRRVDSEEWYSLK
ncbi:unnamed protein product [Peniophora sp. CBMAI 1063]|nr:unnamed protein product [Peniophora sp. CBMAI 1063]